MNRSKLIVLSEGTGNQIAKRCLAIYLQKNCLRCSSTDPNYKILIQSIQGLSQLLNGGLAVFGDEFEQRAGFGRGSAGQPIEELLSNPGHRCPSDIFCFEMTKKGN